MRQQRFKAYRRFRQFGGLDLLWQYTKIGLLPSIIKGAFKLVIGKTNVDKMYAVIAQKVSLFLIQKYELYMMQQKEKYDHMELKHYHEAVIWFCWLQGVEKAPKLVKACYNSIKTNIPEKEIRIVTYNNFSEWVDIPNYIIRKFEKRQIPSALFSDLLRLELLIKYGGTWMDASVLCTGNDYPKRVMDGDLFLFQHIRRNDHCFYGVSNWFITACSNHKILLILRDVLYRYWKDYSCTIQYYIFHLFFNKIASLYPQEITAMPRGNRAIALLLGDRLCKKYNGYEMEEILRRTCFHKLNYRIVQNVDISSDTFYAEIIRRYGIYSN